MALSKLDPNGSYHQEELLYELPDRYRLRDALESPIIHDWHSYGALRPHRGLPITWTELSDQEGYVMPIGTVVTSINLKNPDGSVNQDIGCDAAGDFYVGQGINGPLKSNIKDLYGYDISIDGVMVPTNGTNVDENDLVTQNDVDFKQFSLATGAVYTGADVNTTTALTRKAGMKVSGILRSQIMRETHGRNLSYNQQIAAISILRKGILRVPYVIAGNAVGTRISDPVKAGAGTDPAYAAVLARHQFLLVKDTALMNPEAPVQVDANGRFILSSATTGTPAVPVYPTTVGRIIRWSNETIDDVRELVDTFPDRGLHVPGTMTGGLDRRLFDFVQTIRSANGATTSIADVRAEVDAGNYGYVDILVDTMS